MRCSRTLFALSALALLAGLTTQATAGITVDQSLSDWGLSVNGSNRIDYSSYGFASSYPTGNGTTTIGGVTIHYDIEDSNDSAGHSSYLGPLYGGQDYDAEYLGVATDGASLYVAISTGQRRDNTSQYFAPGDIRIDCGTTVYGIEVGGAVPWGDTLIVDGDSGATFTLNGSGYTTAVTSLGAQLAGSVWQTNGVSVEDSVLGHWLEGIQDKTPPVLTQLVGGTEVGAADYSYFFGSGVGEHAFIELCVPLSVFGGATVTSVGWGPSCGNDALQVSVSISPPPSHAPEPASVLVWAVLALAFGGCGWRRWRRR